MTATSRREVPPRLRALPRLPVCDFHPVVDQADEVGHARVPKDVRRRSSLGTVARATTSCGLRHCASLLPGRGRHDLVTPAREPPRTAPQTAWPSVVCGALQSYAGHAGKDRHWFKANRGRYDEYLLGPARELAAALERFGKPRFFRPYNNVRFHPGPPLKEHLGVAIGYTANRG